MKRILATLTLLATIAGFAGADIISMNLGEGTEERVNMASGDLAGANSVNQQITRLAQVLNSPTVTGAIKVESSNANTPVHTLVKKKDGATYVFSVAMYDERTTATFQLPGIKKAAVERRSAG